MGALALISALLFVGVDLVVGTRLLMLALRTRMAPEAGIGASMFLGGGVGYPLWILASVLEARGSNPAFVAFVAALLFGCSFAALAIAIWRMFHPDKAWVRAIAALAAAAALAAGVAEGLLGPASPISYNVFGAAIFAWAAGENLAYYRLMRRRERIGLAEPILAARFLFWGIAGAASCSITLLSILGRHLAPGLQPPPWLVPMHATLGLGAAVFIWIAFYPPSALRRALDAPARRTA